MMCALRGVTLSPRRRPSWHGCHVTEHVALRGIHVDILVGTGAMSPNTRLPGQLATSSSHVAYMTCVGVRVDMWSSNISPRVHYVVLM
jgi:hypothetical protein